MADSTQLRIGAKGAVFVSPTTRTGPPNPPTGISDTLDTTDWVDLGHIDENGATMSLNRTLKSKFAWRGVRPVRWFVQERQTKVAFTLEQLNPDTLIFALGGGAYSEQNGLYVPPDDQDLDERAMCIEWQDGKENASHRIFFPRGLVTSNIDAAFNKQDTILLKVEFETLVTDDDEDDFSWWTDDPAFPITSG